jgi:membrane fusion protein, multidrug efflux system
MTEASRSPKGVKRYAGAVLWVVIAAIAALLGVDVGGTLVASALVDVRTSVVAAPLTARVAAVRVVDGDEVKAGDVVVELDSAEIDLELALAEAELHRMKSTVLAREVDVKDQDFEVGLRLQADVDKATLTLSTLAAGLKETRSELQSLTALVEKNEKLVKAQLAVAQDLDELKVRQAALAERVAAAADEQRAAQRLRDTAEKRLAEWRGRAGHERTLTAPDAAAVIAQEARVQQVRFRREQLRLRAPVSGRVAGILVGVDDVAREGAPLLTVIDTAPTRATAWVLEDAAWRVRVGDHATLRSVDGRGLALQGRVRALGGGIVEMPIRLRQIPGEPAFGRAVYLDLEPSTSAPPLPGQTFEAAFSASTSTSTLKEP